MTLTLRDIPPDLDAALRKKAEAQHQSVDQVAVEAMQAGLGLAKPESDTNVATSLAAAIRARFVPLGGLELPDPVREPIRTALDLGE